MIGVTDDPVTLYPGALTTYEMLGEDNAAFLVHEAFGHCSTADLNNCTWLALQNYFINGPHLPRHRLIGRYVACERECLFDG